MMKDEKTVEEWYKLYPTHAKRPNTWKMNIISKAGFQKTAVNDPVESSFGGTTRQLQCYGRIGLTNSGGVDQVKRNGYFTQYYGSSMNKENDEGKRNILDFFNKLSYEMRTSLLKVVRDYISITQKRDQLALKKQRKEKQRKEQLLSEHGMAKASEAFIDALYYHEMYNSLACWKTAAMVNQELSKLTSNTSKMRALKENIRMRVLGLGFD